MLLFTFCVADYSEAAMEWEEWTVKDSDTGKDSGIPNDL